ncbi:MAG: hypothetical protein WCS77_09795, partial [Elusimicrobiaceae bacterium]
EPKAFCEASFYVKRSQYRWTRVVLAQDIAKEVALSSDIGALLAVKVVKRGASGHIGQLLLKGTKGEFRLDKEYQIRKLMGIGMLRSAAFVFEPVYEKGRPVEYIISGGGWGHGVGFCQSGSSGRATAGQKYNEILEHYFPGTALMDLRKIR